MFRKDFAPEEAVAIAKAIEPAARREARERQAAGLKQNHDPRVEKFSKRGKTRAMDEVAKAVGMSRVTLDKAKAVVEAARQDPDKYGPVKDEMNRTGKLDPAYKKVTQTTTATVTELRPGAKLGRDR